MDSTRVFETHNLGSSPGGDTIFYFCIIITNSCGHKIYMFVYIYLYMVIMTKIIQHLKYMLFYMTHFITPNPGLNITAFLTIGGFALLGISALLSQLGYGNSDPVIIEIGKAAFYSGLGRAYTQAEHKSDKGEVENENT